MTVDRFHITIPGNVIMHRRNFTNIKGTRYHLVKRIGTGGHGAVFCTAQQRTAVRLFDGTASAAKLLACIEKIGHVPLWDFPLIQPVMQVSAESYGGYVVDLLHGMVPIWDVIMPPQSPDPGTLRAWYVTKTRGLRRRLLQLACAAETLATVHSSGLVLGDPSPNNLLVLDGPGSEVAWITESDGDLPPSEVGILDAGARANRLSFTPGYAAPEIIKKATAVDLNTTFSTSTMVCASTDVYAFAQIVCQALCAVHPFVGSSIPAGDASELLRAYKGEYPWIGDDKDDTNRSVSGYPIEMVMTPTLRRLSQKTFGTGQGEGRNEPLLRPGAERWAQALFDAADLTMPCINCDATFYAIRDERFVANECPWCNYKRGDFALLRIQRWVPAFQEPIFEENHNPHYTGSKLEVGFAIVSEQPMVVTHRIAYGENGITSRLANKPLIELRVNNNELCLKPLEASLDFWVSSNLAGTEPMDLSCSRELPIRDGIYLHFGKAEAGHRVANVILPW